MINLFLSDSINPPNIKKQGGYVVLISTAVFLIMMLLVAFVAVQSNVTQQRLSTDEYGSKAAFEAAEAGLEFGSAYLQSNYAAIAIDSNADGFIDAYSNSAVANVSQSNGSTFSISYSNPIANNFDIITISSRGSSPDALIQRTVSQSFAGIDYMVNSPPAPLTVLGGVNLSGNSSVTNTLSNTSIWSGGSVALSGSASSQGASASSSRTALNADVIQADTGLSTQNSADLFNLFFNQSMASAKSAATVSYTNSTNTNYSSTLSGLTGQIIWIEQTGGTSATINGNTTIGSASEPVLLIVNGDLKINGNMTLYGTLYVANNWSNNGGGNATINGSVIVAGTFSSTGTPDITYDSSITNSLPKLAVSKLPGSWKDF